MRFQSLRMFVVTSFVTLLLPLCVEGRDVKQLATGLDPFVRLWSGKERVFHVSGRMRIDIDKKPVSVELRVAAHDDNSFDLEVTHSEFAVSIRRRANETAMALPLHKVVFIGEGSLEGLNDHLQPAGLLGRLISPSSQAAMIAPLITQKDSSVIASLLTSLLKVSYDGKIERWVLGKNASFKLGEATPSIEASIDQHTFLFAVEKPMVAQNATDWPGMSVVKLNRSELERQLVRGVRRVTEILAPGPTLTNPFQSERKVDHGELRWIDGHRVALLSGTPEQIGKAHGELLSEEATRCIDSVLYSFGTVQTIRTGRWFRQELEQAHSRLAPHIPEDHVKETRALAASLRIDPKLAEVVNVFPEMFHCSGFAVFGNATVDGKLYHGRVLDYMTTIGLQDAATTFIVAVEGKIPFANVGYGGFIGSVSGMNSKAISLGEMGGKGEGKWDGVPMATLMRRALEECSTLDDVMELWTKSPRTCEYYYVFADGKTNRAVGVSALPESIEFIKPGDAHPLLGEGIKDTVVMSAGSRLEELRRRVTERHGRIDADVGQWLMSRPVAMESNLHNVLFVPQDGLLYVANADHKRPAAERPYVRLNLTELLESMNVESSTAAKRNSKARIGAGNSN